MRDITLAAMTRMTEPSAGFSADKVRLDSLSSQIGDGHSSPRGLMTEPGVQVVRQFHCGPLHGMPAYHRENRSRDLLLGAGEAPGVAHVRPHVGLYIRERLAQMVAVVVHPFVKQVFDREAADVGMHAATLLLFGAQGPNQLETLPPYIEQLLGQIFGIARGVVADFLETVAIVFGQVWFVAAEDDPDPARESVLLGHDYVPDHLVYAPLTRRRMPRRDAGRERT